MEIEILNTHKNDFSPVIGNEQWNYCLVLGKN